jgi:hypothetical protein
MEWLMGQGACVFAPFGHSPDIDLVAELNGRLLRIEVKTTRRRTPRGNWDTMLATRGGNRSWSGTVKTFDRARCDYLFVHVGDGRRWFIPAEELSAGSGLTLGGPRYSEYEVESGRPLLESPRQPGECPSGQREQTVNLPALPTQVRILPPPTPPAARAAPAVGRTRVSGNHQVTIPSGPYEAAGIEPGDQFRVEAAGPGRILLTRAQEAAAEHRRQLGLGDV